MAEVYAMNGDPGTSGYFYFEKIEPPSDENLPDFSEGVWTISSKEAPNKYMSTSQR